MKCGKIAISAVIIMLCISAPYMYLSHASQTPSVSFDPSTVTNISIGSTFTLSLQISGVANLWGWGVGLAWDPSILQMASSPVEDPFLKTAGSTVFVASPPNNTLGTVESIGCILLSYASVAGNGYLTNVTFNVIGTGTCKINITDAQFKSPPDPGGNDGPIIPVAVTNATFSNIIAVTPSPNPSIHGPKAIFSPADGLSFKVGSTITLDAAASLPGYDTANVSEVCPITNYAWRVEFLNGTTFASLSGQNPSFTASIQTTFRVILIVTATDPHPPSDPSFQATDSGSAIINIVSNPQDTQIDVFTDRGGNGQGANSSAYGPLQTVQIYALVSNHNNPLAKQNVLFNVKSANGSNYALIQGTTNQSGIANTQFRLPAPDPSSPITSLGTWTITATVNTTSSTVSDTLNFNFNHLSGIEDVQILSSIQRSSTITITLTINNANCPYPWSNLKITIFDQAGIPIGSSTVATKKQTQNITVISASIAIPPWAFTGQATVYLCLLTNSSNTSNIPLAPETIATFQILE